MTRCAVPALRMRVYEKLLPDKVLLFKTNSSHLGIHLNSPLDTLRFKLSQTPFRTEMLTVYEAPLFCVLLK